MEYIRFKAAAVQAAPVFLEREATVEKACGLIREAAGEGARLIVFPETWIPGYPVWTHGPARWEHEPTKRLYARFYRQCVTIPGPATDSLCEAARDCGAHVVMGVNEIDAGGLDRTIYNTLLFIDDRGNILGKHRKITPTYHERLIWGAGNAEGMKVYETSLGKLGGLICWEHWVPLARYYLYTQGEQIHCAVWPVAEEMFQVACRHYAHEGRVFVISACSYLTREMFPEDFELAGDLKKKTGVIFNGGSAIIGPDGHFLAGPAYDTETILYADIDTQTIYEESQKLDVVGHYSRPDLFRLLVNKKPKRYVEEMDWE